MSCPDIGASELHPKDGPPRIRQLLFVSDAAVADAAELPPAVRSLIDAAEVYVVTPSLPGRLAWLTDELNASRHAARPAP
jgi:hypothetical protein